MIHKQDPKPSSHPKCSPTLIPGSMKGCYHDALALPRSGSCITDREFCALARIKSVARRDRWTRERMRVWREMQERRDAQAQARKYRAR